MSTRISKLAGAMQTNMLDTRMALPNRTFAPAVEPMLWSREHTERLLSFADINYELVIAEKHFIDLSYADSVGVARIGKLELLSNITYLPVPLGRRGNSAHLLTKI